MALFTEQFIQKLYTLVEARQQETAAALGLPAIACTAHQQLTSPLYQQARRLVRVANGEITRGNATTETVEQIALALDTLLDLLLGNPLYARAPFPADFWQSDIGVLVSRVRWWLWADELITISNAAALAFGDNTQANRMKIVRAIDGGLLDWVPDPSVANPQQNRRVLRHQVERLGEQRRPPE